jgi:hypothetical protein
VHPIVSAARATITARLTFRLSADNESPALPAGAGKLAVDEIRIAEAAQSLA